jgi:hypothetical protein
MFFVSLLSAGYRSSPSMEWDKMHCPQLSEMCLYGSRTPKLVIVVDSSPVVKCSSDIWGTRNLRGPRQACPTGGTQGLLWEMFFHHDKLLGEDPAQWAVR